MKFVKYLVVFYVIIFMCCAARNSKYPIIGKCYRYTSPDPFDKFTIDIKVIDVKGKYYKFKRLHSCSIGSQPISFFDGFVEIECKDSCQ